MHAEWTGLAGTELGFSPGSASDCSIVSCSTSFSLSFLIGKMGLPYQPQTDIVRIKHKNPGPNKSSIEVWLTAVPRTFSLSKELHMISVHFKTHSTRSSGLCIFSTIGPYWPRWGLSPWPRVARP